MIADTSWVAYSAIEAALVLSNQGTLRPNNGAPS